MKESPDDRSPLARAMVVASQVMTIAAQMVVPILIGYWLDTKLHTSVVFVALGAVIGLTSGIWSLVRMTQPPRRKDGQGRQKRGQGGE